jgi:DNA-binding GntR family transcriptional regulator
MTTTPPATTLSKQVVDHVRSQIVSGHLSAGARVKEREIAEELQVSRGPVREALRLLEREGLLEVRPYSGARVIRIERTEIDEIVTLRRQVEYFAITNAALASTPQIVGELAAIAADMKLAHELRDVTRLVDLDSAFHQTICEASGHRALTAVLQTLLPRLMILWYPQAYRSHTPESFMASHVQLVKLIEERDVAGCASAIDEHILRNFSVDVRLTPLPTFTVGAPLSDSVVGVAPQGDVGL